MKTTLTFKDFLLEKYNNEINEGRKTVKIKRKYTEKYPAVNAGNYGPVREKILSFVREKEDEGGVTLQELKEFINNMNEEIGTKTSANWIYKNKKYLKGIKEGERKVIKLSKFGNRVLDRTVINEASYAEIMPNITDEEYKILINSEEYKK